jgi:hypothetical protein
MSDIPTVRASFWDASSGCCDCCGNQARTIWGDLSDASGAKAVYYVQWTHDKPEHFPNFDLIIGPWGDGTLPEGRVLVSLVYRPQAGGGSFMVINAHGRRAKGGLYGRALDRAEVIGTPLAVEVFALLDALWLTEPCLGEVRALDNLA